MSGMNARLAVSLNSLLTREGFDATLQQRAPETAGDFEPEVPAQGWVDIATVKAVWDNPRNQVLGLNDSGAASMVTRRMTIAYRDGLKRPESAIELRVVVNGVANKVLGISEIGEKVGLRLMLDAGTER